MKQSYRISGFKKDQIKAFKKLKWFNQLIPQRLLRHHCTKDNYLKNKEKPCEKRKLGPKEKLSPRKKSRIFTKINRRRTTISKFKKCCQINCQPRNNNKGYSKFSQHGLHKI